MVNTKKVSRSKKSPQQLRKLISRIFPVLIICILGFLIYSNSFQCTFHFDDGHNIVNNDAIKNIRDIKTIWNFSNRRFIGYLTFAFRLASPTGRYSWASRPYRAEKAKHYLQFSRPLRRCKNSASATDTGPRKYFCRRRCFAC